MQKTILITGSTDGIGLEAAKKLAQKGHTILLHGRNEEKLAKAARTISNLTEKAKIDSYLADLSDMESIKRLADDIAKKHDKLDIIVNNAGIFRTSDPITKDGLDVRFAVNSLAPALLTKKLLPLLTEDARIINLSSAAQASVNPDALLGKVRLEAMEAYSQSKLALTMWSAHMGQKQEAKAPVYIALNPGSLLATKMVKEGFGMTGNDMQIGANIIVRSALDKEFATASGRYFDNDQGRFAQPHSDAQNADKNKALAELIDTLI
ncbi:MAG: SDR family NAD(P)-dependent oxidoreductase [Cohaesibacter sp.]|jgi:NAD(P)-dependent dehydrogenase (short-subunit alcohol dehydrogenase family)|nr:SDR family NAD(P)-dependent oxidoreductase [Cohaesibacter sp.]